MQNHILIMAKRICIMENPIFPSAARLTSNRTGRAGLTSNQTWPGVSEPACLGDWELVCLRAVAALGCRLRYEFACSLLRHAFGSNCCCRLCLWELAGVAWELSLLWRVSETSLRVIAGVDCVYERYQMEAESWVCN